MSVYPEKMTFVLESFEDGSSTIYVIGLDVSDCSNCGVLYDAPSFFARGIEKGHLRLSYEAPNTVNAYPSLIGYNLVYVDVPFITLDEVEEGTEMQVFYTNVDYNPEAAREAARLAHEREEQEKKEKELADMRENGVPFVEICLTEDVDIDKISFACKENDDGHISIFVSGLDVSLIDKNTLNSKYFYADFAENFEIALETGYVRITYTTPSTKKEASIEYPFLYKTAKIPFKMVYKIDETEMTLFHTLYIKPENIPDDSFVKMDPQPDPFYDFPELDLWISSKSVISLDDLTLVAGYNKDGQATLYAKTDSKELSWDEDQFEIYPIKDNFQMTKAVARVTEEGKYELNTLLWLWSRKDQCYYITEYNSIPVEIITETEEAALYNMIPICEIEMPASAFASDTDKNDEDVSDMVQLAGDVNGDGKVNMKDVSVLIKKLAGWDIDADNTDFNGDGKVNSTDVEEILKMLSGWN